MLTLPIKKKWFDMICSGEKKEEYREITPYYTSRFKTIGLLDKHDNPTEEDAIIKLRNGYSREADYVVVRVKLRKGEGFTMWGAIPDEWYYVLRIIKIIDA